ncbi:MAG: excisionase [Parcubacteria group bacterium]|jgi:excisionase family DNA binding protein|nr:excisionase [Parcubacteria group bacterium]|tara:strand:+ start:3475 stop:3669 length:195 start_codon:yes stop_codon:yes gene_type:complete
MPGYDLLTMEQVAKRLGVSLKTVYRWIDSGELPVSQIGKRTYRIFERDLVKFIYSRRINKGKKR